MKRTEGLLGIVLRTAPGRKVYSCSCIRLRALPLQGSQLLRESSTFKGGTRQLPLILGIGSDYLQIKHGVRVYGAFSFTEDAAIVS